jgi:hypothetical protein
MKRFLALTLAGVVTLSSTAFASEISEEHWAYSDMLFGEDMEWCDRTQYADNITYEVADEIMTEVLWYLMWDDAEYDRFFDVINYTNGYVTRGEWAEALKKAISMEYDEVVAMCADEDIDAVKSPESSEYTHEPMSFDDVTTSDKYADSISFCNDYKLMTGYGDNTFKADEYITYAEAMASVDRLLNTENSILTDMGVDMDIFYEEYFDDYDYGYGDSYDVFGDIEEKLGELSEKAVKGTLKSTRKLNKNTEAAIERVVNLEDSVEPNSQLNIKSSGVISADVSAMGIDVKGDYTFDVDCKMIYDDNSDPAEYAIKINTKLNSPELMAVMDLEDEDTSRTVEYYLKDGNLYINTNGDKHFMPYEDDDLLYEELVDLRDESNLLVEYILKESVESGSVTSKKDGKETIVLNYDVKKLLATVGLDIDKLIEEGETDADVELSPLKTELIVNGDNKREAFNCELSGSFDAEGCKGTFSIIGDVSYNYDETPIAYPDFSDYTDIYTEFGYPYDTDSELYDDEQEIDTDEDIDDVLFPTA